MYPSSLVKMFELPIEAFYPSADSCLFRIRQRPVRMFRPTEDRGERPLCLILTLNKERPRHYLDKVNILFYTN